MDITNINLGACPLQYLSIGYVGETGARPVKFDFSAWATEYGAGVLQLLLQRPGDANPYPVVLDIDGTTATWTPDATATEKTGQGQAQLVYTVGGVVVKNAIFRVLIAPSLGAAGDPPEPYEDWLERLLTIAAEAQQSAIDAAGSAEAAGTSAGAAAGSAGAAAQSAADAEAAKTAAETAEQTAQQAATLARAKAAEAAEAGRIAGENADYAQHQSTMAADSAEAAYENAERAAQSEEDAQAAASAAQTAATAAGASADSAEAAADEVETKGAEQITAINQAGATQIAAVDAAGAAQVQAIEDKGEEVIASIPSDYTELADEVSELKSSLDSIGDDVDAINSILSSNKVLTPTAVTVLVGILRAGVYSESVSAKLEILEQELNAQILPDKFVVAYNLDHAVSSNTAISVTEGASFATTITASGTGYEIETVTVTMGGTDITSTAYESTTGSISISSVTGDILITAKATTTVYLVPVRSGYPNVTTFVYTPASWQQSFVFENSTISGGTMVVTFDDTIVTNFQFNVYVVDSAKNPYKLTSYKKPENLDVQGDWMPYWYDAGSGSSFCTAAKTFSLDIPDGCYAFLFLRFNNATYGGTVVTDSTSAAQWVENNNGITVGIKGGIPDGN